MHCPSFQVSEFGLFDSRVKFPDLLQTSERPVTEYELEFYPAGHPGMAYINGEAHPMHHGAFLCAKPGQTRYSRLHYRCYYVHMTTDDPELDGLLRRLPDAGFLAHMEEVTAVFQELLVLNDLDALSSRLSLQVGVCRLIGLLAQDSQTAPHTSAHAALMLRAERHIRLHFAEPLTLTTLAAAVNLSPVYFHRLFSDFFGQTPAQYLLNCRIANAKLKLLDETCSLSRLTADCGFSSQSYFCRKFKQATGKTPLQYRRETLSQLNS